MNPQTILYAITIIGGAALALYTTYKGFQNVHSYDDGQPNYTYYRNDRRRRSTRNIPKKTDDCIICFATMEIGQLHITKCNHMFHKKCLSDWLNYNKVCPICRAQVINI